jgi:VWFA-related protein
MPTIGRRRVARLTALLAFLLFSVASLFAQETAASRQRIQVEVNLVTLRFTVRDERGEFLNTLKRDSFRVFENRQPKDIAFFELPSNRTGRVGPLWLAFLLDVSGSTFATRSEEILAAQAFFESVQNVTQIGIFGFTDKLITFQDFTSSRNDAAKAFLQARQHLGQTAIYDSLDRLVDKLASRAKSADRKIIIVVSDGADKDYARSEATVRKAQANNVSVYTILVPSAAQLYIGNTGEHTGEEQTSDAALKANQEQAFARLSLETGGKHFAGYETILDFDQTLAQISDDVYGNLYTLGFYTDYPQLDKSQRDVRVDVSSPGARLSALIQSLPERLTQKKRYIAALFDAEALSRLSESMPADFEEIGAEFDVLPSRREGGQLGLPFRVKISPYSLGARKKTGVRSQFGIIGLLLDRQGREVVRLREFFRANLSPKEMEAGRSIIYNNKLMAPPGTYDLRLAVLDLTTWRVTVFNSAVQITEE